MPLHAHQDELVEPVPRHIWATRYRQAGPRDLPEPDIRATRERVAHALAAVEPHAEETWRTRFLGILDDFRFLPGGRILAGAGSDRRVTLLNCFVMGRIEDSIDGIFRTLHESAITMQHGGGIGLDFSTLRPRGMPAHSTGRIASGAVSFMHILDAVCTTMLSTGARRGAMMATLRCDHPDIRAFIRAKHTAGALRCFNLSVQITDAFLEAVESDRKWPLVFPDASASNHADTVLRPWPGRNGPVRCRIAETIRARDLWASLTHEAYAHAEPGVLFIDRINACNNLYYLEDISATNPCGEVPLPPYGACDLGSINLTRFVRDPFTPNARLNFGGIENTAAIAVRLLDNALDATRFPLPRQAETARASRRLGLGVTGLADALIMLGVHYDSGAARATAAAVMRTIRDAAYRTSIGLARERGAFPRFDRARFTQAPFIRALPDDIRASIDRHGIRNSHLTAIAPTGTVSLLANAVSPGIEPVYGFEHQRPVLDANGEYRTFPVTDYALRKFREVSGDAPRPPAFVTAHVVSPEAHLAMQAALQPFVDNAISKTINIPSDYPERDFGAIFLRAAELGLKGCTVFRPNPVTGALLDPETGPVDRHCCRPERECD
jgi:ribonucleoside-diphosphate reductase alpha chain